MAKKLNRIELAFTRFDDITKRHLDRIEKNYKDFGGIPEVKQKKKKIMQLYQKFWNLIRKVNPFYFLHQV